MRIWTKLVIIRLQRVALMRNSGCVGAARFLHGKKIISGRVFLEQTNQFLGTEPVGKLMGRYAVPCVISLLVGALYNIVDQIFIANASYLGSYGNAANTVVFPLTVVALAIAVMVGDGCCASVSICLGREDSQTARASVGGAVVMSLGSGLALTIVYLLFQTQIISLFGGTGAHTLSNPHPEQRHPEQWLPVPGCHTTASLNTGGADAHSRPSP